MKILHIINNLSSGGAEKLIEELLPHIHGGSVVCDVLLLSDINNVFDRKLKELGIQIDVVPFRKIYSFMNIRLIRKYIIEGKYDLVHVHLFPAQYWASIAVQLIFKDKPIIITTEHNTHNRRREKFYFRYFDKYIYSRYKKIVSISDQTQEQLKDWLQVRTDIQNKFIVINNGINIKAFEKAEPYLKSEVNVDFTEKTKLVCMVGRFSDQKDQSTLIKAIRELPNEIHLLLIGEGPNLEKNRDLAKGMEIGDRIHFLGFRNDVDRIIKTSDVVVQSSMWEGFGLAAVEGMAAGKPIIASDVPGLREVVKDAGLVFPKGDYKELANTIYTLLIDHEKYEDLSKSCTLKAREYSIEEMARKTYDLYKQVVRTKPK